MSEQSPQGCPGHAYKVAVTPHNYVTGHRAGQYEVQRLDNDNIPCSWWRVGVFMQAFDPGEGGCLLNGAPGDKLTVRLDALD